ncbi:hypothetical protein HaLaN_23181, partial [Haematococcus lacustris]
MEDDKPMAEVDALASSMADLSRDNGVLRAALLTSQELVLRLASEKAALAEMVGNLGGMVPADMQWQMTSLTLPAPGH